MGAEFGAWFGCRVPRSKEISLRENVSGRSMLGVDKRFGLGVAVGGDRAALAEGGAFGGCAGGICATPAKVGGGPR